MIQKSNLVSVIIPSHNREKYLERSVRSVLNQTYDNIEVIIIDDNSIDNTENLINLLQQEDKRILYIRHETNKGAQAARNTGIYASKGEWIAFLDSDDEWLPKKIEKQLSYASEFDASVVYSEAYLRDDNLQNNEMKLFGIPPFSGDIYKNLLANPGPMYQGLLVRKSCFEKISYLDETIVSYQEWDTSIKLAKYYNFIFIAEPLYIYYKNINNSISTDIKRDIQGYLQILTKYHDEIDKVAGKNSLIKHYLIIAKKYYSTGEYNHSSLYFKKAAQNSLSLRRLKYNLQAQFAIRNLNPNILDINILLHIARLCHISR